MTRRLGVLTALLMVVANASARAQVTAASDPFFDDTVVHEVRLDINAKDWQTLKQNYLSNAYYPSDFHWGSEVVRNVGIRSRGTASRSDVKPGLRVDFNRYASGQSFMGLKSFVLRNNTTDFSNMHERISMLFFRRMGVPAPREAHTRLFVNGAYAGLYTIVESLDVPFLERNFGEGEGNLYKFDRNVGDPPYYFEYAGQNQDLYVPHPFKPETNESDPQPQPIVDMLRAIAEPSDAVFRSAITEYLDLAAFIKQVAIEVFLGDTDGLLGYSGSNNFYLYRHPNQHQHILIPWDKSEAMHEGPDYGIFRNVDDVPEDQQNKLMIRAIAFPDLKNLYLDTLEACAASAAESDEGDPRSWIAREVDREYFQIREAVLADTQKPYTNDQFEEAVEAMRKFARQRSDIVETAVENKR